MIIMVFNKESDFEVALIKALTEHGWEKKILKNYTEEQLLQNWADILYENNRDIDRLNDYPLTKSEMKQILEQVNVLRTPLRLNGFINGGSVSVKRDNPKDELHYGKEVSLKIYNRNEIAAGSSRYQIVQQPDFPTKSKILNDRRGDVMLLINGMPVIHIELKKSGIPVSQASTQIEKYAGEGIFTGLFSLIQIFVAMNPDETLYFANPGPDGRFNPDFYFHWADFDNEPINEWHRIASTLLSIPMAHQLIGFYTIADDADGQLKVLRSYQYQAVNKISDKVAMTHWEEKNQLGGYIWHTTGSGKTMTSFKAAQLISFSKDADKVIFLVDRIELGTQSLKEYRSFAGAGLTEEQKQRTVQETEDTYVLVSKLKSDDAADTLIVTSIQKMGILSLDNIDLRADDLKKINSKRVVFIVDECHRSTFGDTFAYIKQAFPRAIFFGFTGTPIHDENKKKMNTTSDIFGDELHRYSIADGIRDKNVLGFDPYKVLTFKDRDVRRAVALEQAKAGSEEEALADNKKKEVYMRYMNEVPMCGYVDKSGKYNRGIEDFIPTGQYFDKSDPDNVTEHQMAVVEDILAGWTQLSVGNKFHAIFATSSIPEAIAYYRIFKEKAPELKVCGLFDPSIDNVEGFEYKEDGLVELIEDYNRRYNQSYSLSSFQKLKKDISARLAHKKPYQRIEKEPEGQVDLLIVVNQMLTGFDSKWINTLYLDKVIEYENIIQAFSRTNRLFGPDKPFGTIKYYRKPHTMERNIEEAVKLYSGDKPPGLFAHRLNYNIEMLNHIYKEIELIFKNAGVENFERLPGDDTEKRKFAQVFNQLNDYLEAAKIQGLDLKKREQECTDKDGKPIVMELEFDEARYLILVQRYKELEGGGGGGPDGEDIPYDLKGYITEIDTGKIDADYMNSRFQKYLKLLKRDEATQEQIQAAKEELHRTFATLTQEEQKYANIFLHDIERGDVVAEEKKDLRDYINEYLSRAKSDQIHNVAKLFGVDEVKLREMVNLNLTEVNLNEFGRFDALKATIDKAKAKEYFEGCEGMELSQLKVNQKTSRLLREFILRGGFDIEAEEKYDIKEPSENGTMMAAEDKTIYG